ncbi:tyrosinase [Mucilaginibacter frigoritolerans]|uniref:Tyrosinase n=1 Tax=Mucilaginibacter frigoritolerans TaxID=652788 RepID=A0A562UDK5_9SPHI|nr:tyrosinase family protein [Mucilaginibacter frigoritolerans]TWJ03201.1 tyrosinase [Mucilaginibacter frigoritolerans]
MKERKNVYLLPAGDTTLAWYSKAVVEMKKRPTTDPTSWNYQAAMHGFNASLSFWRGAAPLPSQTEQNQYWNQCQHGSWFFLPWHRMYLAYFEQIVAATIVKLGGPADWALPYWNYSDTSNPNARTIPPAFTNPNNATNGLWITGRVSDTIPPRYVTLGALNTIPYTGDGRTSPLGFGGPETGFSHSGGTHGQLESLPHDMVHVAIGGAMGDPRTAALDPIFWLHHANIDRLWQVWLNMAGGRINPNKSSWLDYNFYFHNAAGQSAQFTSKQVEDTRQVLSGYTYQGVPVGGPTLRTANALQNADFSTPLEITAATNQGVTLGSAKTVAHLGLNASPQKAVNLAATTNSAVSKPALTILHFENVTGKGVPPIYDVYLNEPQNGGDKESYYAGSVSFFGVEEASTPSVHQSGSGQHYALDISDLVNKLRSSPNWKDQQLDVSIEPSRAVDADASVNIGRISVYSE